jgi:hypothetical protein
VAAFSLIRLVDLDMGGGFGCREKKDEIGEGEGGKEIE